MPIWKVVPEYTADPSTHLAAETLEYVEETAVFKDEDGNTIAVFKQFSSIEEIR